MDAQDQLRAGIAISKNKRPRRLRQTLFLLSTAVVGLAATDAGPVFDAGHNFDRVFKPGKTLAAAPADASTSAIHTASVSAVDIAPATAATGADTLAPLQDGFKLAGDRVAAAASAAKAAPQVANQPDRLFGIGDKVKITFYERVDVEDAKWGRTSSALRGIEQRPELSGEYAVQEDGTISIPLLGPVTVATQSEQQVQNALAQSFEKKFGRKGMVNVLLMERPPVYVLGPVKTPGSFKYMPGMTVLHVIALAGGLDRDRGSNDPWQKIEAVRTIEKRSASIDSMLKLLARQAVLRAERDGSTPKIPAKLVKLVGPTEAASLVDEQEDRRKAVAMARREREQTAQSAVDSAKQDLRMYTRTDALDDLVRTRQERVDAIRSLVEKNVAPKAALSQVQAELSDAEQRRQDALNQYSMAKERLAQLQNDALRARTDLANDLTTEIEVTDRQISENQHEIETGDGVLSTLPATRSKFADATAKTVERTSYVIVRQTPSGPIRMESDGMTLLRPGDLVEIVTSQSQATESYDVPQPAPEPTRQRGPIERASR
jgi:protein involved in polysaccharide export with SLBB domain